MQLAEALEVERHLGAFEDRESTQSHGAGARVALVERHLGAFTQRAQRAQRTQTAPSGCTQDT